MVKSFPVHVIGDICWLPPHKPNQNRFPPAINFRALAKFTSNYSAPDMTALVNYSPVEVSDQNKCFKVRLYFSFLEGKEGTIRQLTRNCEVILLDSYKVIAVCRNISLPDTENIFLEDEWIK